MAKYILLASRRWLFRHIETEEYCKSVVETLFFAFKLGWSDIQGHVISSLQHYGWTKEETDYF